ADRRHQWPGGKPLLTQEQQEELRQALAGPVPDGGHWTPQAVAEWIGQRLGHPVRYQLGWDYFRRPKTAWCLPHWCEINLCTIPSQDSLALGITRGGLRATDKY